MRRQYARIRRSEAQAAQQRKKAEALLESVRFLEVTASDTEKGTSTQWFLTKLTSLSASLPLAAFLESLRKLYDIPIPDPGANASTRPSASKEAFIAWAVDKFMKENGMDKIAGKGAEKEAKAIFDSDDDMPNTSAATERLPPPLDEEEDEDGSMSASSTDEEKDR